MVSPKKDLTSCQDLQDRNGPSTAGRRMCRGERRRDGEKEGGSLGSLRRADRREVKTKHADWQDLLSDGADKQASALYFGRVGHCGPVLRIPRAPN